MGAFEWFLLIVVVLAIPLATAIIVTLWTLEQALKRNRKNRRKPTRPTETAEIDPTPDASEPTPQSPAGDS